MEQLPPKTLQNNIMAFGQTTMTKYSKLRIFIQGMRGVILSNVGIEVVKLLLALRPQSITIHDTTNTEINDMSFNFFGYGSQTSRGESIFAELQTVNQYLFQNTGLQTQLKLFQPRISHALGPQVWTQFDLIIFTDFWEDIDLLIELNQTIRDSDKPMGFIWTGVLGLYGFVFVDFGKNFKIFDKSSDEEQIYLIQDISNSNPGIVTLNKDKPHKLMTGDFIRIYDLEGMQEVSGADVRPIKVLDEFQFTIEDTTEFQKYVRGGIVELAKVPFKIPFKSLQSMLQNPFLNPKECMPYRFFQFYGSDQEKAQAKQYHLGLLGILQFVKQNKMLPRLNNVEDCEKVTTIVEALNRYNKESNAVSVEIIDQNILNNMCLFARTNISPFCSMIASITALHGIKFTGKFIPLQEMMHLNCFDCLSDAKNMNRTIEKNRYDDYISIFGREFVNKLQSAKLKIFIINKNLLIVFLYLGQE